MEKQSEQDIEKFFMKLKEFGPISESYENFCPKIIVCGGLNKLKLGGKLAENGVYSPPPPSTPAYN